MRRLGDPKQSAVCCYYGYEAAGWVITLESPAVAPSPCAFPHPVPTVPDISALLVSGHHRRSETDYSSAATNTIARIHALNFIPVTPAPHLPHSTSEARCLAYLQPIQLARICSLQ